MCVHVNTCPPGQNKCTSKIPPRVTLRPPSPQLPSLPASNNRAADAALLALCGGVDHSLVQTEGCCLQGREGAAHTSLEETRPPVGQVRLHVAARRKELTWKTFMCASFTGAVQACMQQSKDTS